jgi:RNA polymerase sigma factor (sigma-70 family)
LTEIELIQGCLKENRECQRTLFNLYAGKMMTVCLRYTRHRAEAEDVLQDSFVKIFNNLDKFEGKGSFEGWVRRIVINTALKAIERFSFQKEAIGLENIHESSSDPSIFSELSANELLTVISKLPDGYRTVFNLHAIEGFSHKEIGEMLGIEESTSRSQLTKARATLQNWLTVRLEI